MIEASDVKANQARMESARMNYDSVWAEIARLVYPEQDNLFGGGMRTSKWMREQPETRTAHEPYATQALEDGVADAVTQSETTTRRTRENADLALRRARRRDGMENGRDSRSGVTVQSDWLTGRERAYQFIGR